MRSGGLCCVLWVMASWCGVGLGQSQAPAAGGSLQWEQREVEIPGTFKEPKVTATYRFRNGGTAAVTILQIKPSCGSCTSGELKKRTYEPGEKGEIQISYSTGGRPGRHEKVILVKTDDKAQPEQMLRLRVLLQEVARLEPQFLFWQVGESASGKTVRVAAVGDQRFTVASVQGYRMGAESRVIREGQEYELTVTPESTARPGMGMVAVELEVPDQGRCRLRVGALVRPEKAAGKPPGKAE